MSRYRSYMICTAPRSGSTLLCRLLAAVGTAGNPNSHFHVPALKAWCAAYGLSRDGYASHRDCLRAVFAAAMAKGSGGSDVFGLRVQQGSFAYFLSQAHLLHPGTRSDLEVIHAAFGPTLFIRLKRDDKIAQAVSREIAEQSGLWHRAADGSELERLAPPQTPIYDRAAIAGHIDTLTEMEAKWDAWFDTQQIAPLRISYDEISAAPQAVLAKILTALGQDPAPAAQVPPPTAKLADATNRAWIERFMAGD